MADPYAQFADPSDPYAAFAAPVQKKDARKPNQALGFAKGVKHVLGRVPQDPVSMVSERIFPSTRASRERIEAGADKWLAGDEKTRPGKVGEVAGGIVATLPTMAFGPIAGGAMAGSLLSDAKDFAGTAKDAAIGAIGGKVGDVAMRGVARVADNLARPAMTALRAQGVRTTPGQAVGGPARVLEDKLQSLPYVGKAITQGRERSIDDFNRGAVNLAMAPMGKTAPKGAEAGHQSVAWAQDAVSDAYNTIVPKITVKPDARFAVSLRDATKNMSMLQEPERKQVFSIIESAMAPGKSGTLSGSAFQRADRLLGEKRAAYATGGPDQQAMAKVFGEIQEGLRDAVERQNPAVAKGLSAARAAFARLTRVETAASRSADGTGRFTPAQFKEAVRAGDGSVRKKQVARGEALMQDYSRAALQTLPRMVGDSGTAGREATWNPLAHVAGAVGLAGYRAGQGMVGLMSRHPRAVAQGARAAGRRSGAVATPLLVGQDQ